MACRLEKADAATTLRPTYLRVRFAERLPLTLPQRNARRAKQSSRITDSILATHRGTGRVPCFSEEVNSETALHDGHRAAKIEIAAPGYLRNIVVIISEMGLRYKKELFPMKIGACRSRKRIGTHRGLEDDERHRRYAIDPSRPRGIPTPDGGNAWERISVSQPETRNGEAVHDQSAQGLGRDAEESGSAVFCSLRTSSHVRYQVERWRRRRSHGDADVETERCGGIQAVQSGQARNDARGARQAGSAGK
jgi:hypothetical protein